MEYEYTIDGIFIGTARVQESGRVFYYGAEDDEDYIDYSSLEEIEDEMHLQGIDFERI